MKTLFHLLINVNLLHTYAHKKSIFIYCATSKYFSTFSLPRDRELSAKRYIVYSLPTPRLSTIHKLFSTLSTEAKSYPQCKNVEMWKTPLIETIR